MRTLIVFDFDFSLLDDDSDRFVMALAEPALRAELDAEYKAAHPPWAWTDWMDHVAVQLQMRQGLTPTALAAALGNIAFHADMRQAIREARAVPGTELVVLSDANTFFIDTVLRAYDAHDIFSTIVTNPATTDPETGLLRIVRRVQADDLPHGCTRGCAANICKGTELQRLLHERGGRAVVDRVVYVGDGKNDICPTIDLGPRDYVLARADRALHQFWSNDGGMPGDHSQRSGGQLAPNVIVWADGTDVRRLFASLL